MLNILRFQRNLRFYSIKHAKKEPIKYTSTINLPKTKFPSRLTWQKRHELERKLVETALAGGYKYQEANNNEPQFILHDGPPYANGDLHMGHAVNKILKDITIRQRVIKGEKVHYIPGWDCHGLPIELKALADGGKGKSVSTAAAAADPVIIRKKSRKFALDAIESQKSEFRSWGILSDWLNDEKLYFTFNPQFTCSQLQLFWNLYQKGLVYRDLKPVYWSPSSRTALAEAELEYDNNFKSPSVYVRFELNGIPDGIAKSANEKIFALVWTTTPWTLPSNQAVCYNSQLDYALVKLKSSDSRNNELYLMATKLLEDFENSTNMSCEIIQTIKGTQLKECSYLHPIFNEKNALPFFDATHVQDSKGTGLVHTAPAHGPDDFLIFLDKNIPVISLVNEDGLYNAKAPNDLQGKHVLKEGNDIVMKLLNSNLIHSSTFSHSYPIDWRTKQPVIIRASEQWFINTSQLKEKAMQEIDKIEIYPRVNAEASKKSLRTQVQKRPYWCISRQRSWGVPIPVFYDKKTQQVIFNSEILNHICDLVTKEGNIDFWWQKSVAEILPANILQDLNLNANDIEKGLDIFDIWFDSGSTWSQVLQGQQVADLYLEGYDQFTGWFQSSLLTSIAARNCSPYKALFVHGFTVDEKGHKMSKSLGNVISPKDIREDFGVDVLRWWVASHATQHMAITVSDSLLEGVADNLHKIRSTLRYLNGVIGEKSKKQESSPLDLKNTSYINRYLLSKLVDFEQEIFSLYDSYEYNRVTAAILNFVINHISGIYLNFIKDRLYCGFPEEIAEINECMQRCYLILSKALWPIAPFLIEESWSYYDPKTTFQQQHNIKTDPAWKDSNIEEIIDACLELKRNINQKATEKYSWHLGIIVRCNKNILQVFKELHPFENVAVSNTELCEILQVQSVQLEESNSKDLENMELLIGKADGSLLCLRCRRFAVSCEADLCKRCLQVLDTLKAVKLS